ncbi:MAG: hypothetical protein MUD15_09670 [Desulfobacterota bacterium]|jgi:hypothetical protein|nr:hypothetical protein [Thermodesulfobacteriota bacterium]
MDQEPHGNISQPETTALARLIRLTWKILGNFLLFIILILIIIASPGARNVLDVVFWLVVVGLILLRYIDIKVFREQSADNKPATLQDWGKYSIGIILLSGFFWVVARAIVMRIQ